MRALNLLGVVALLAASAAPLAGQDVPNRALATRAELQDLLNRKGKSAPSSDERRRAQDRLDNGDFQVGDQVVMRVRGDTGLSNTFIVKSGLILVLPDMPEVHLKGVLRSEIQATLLAAITQYLKAPQVEVEPLVRVGLLGSVARPGYYTVRADIPMSEVLMVAGGMTPDAELSKTKAVRGSAELRSTDEVRQAMASGMSLDQFGFQGGDEIVVGRRGGGFAGAVPIIGAMAAAALAIIGITAAL